MVTEVTAPHEQAQLPARVFPHAHHAAMSRTRILIVDDHPIVIHGVRHLLDFEPDFEVVGHASNGLEAVKMAISTEADLVILDLRLPDVAYIDLCRRMRAALPNAQVVIFTAFIEGARLRACLACGVAGVLIKDAQGLDLVRDLRRIRSGVKVIDIRVLAALESEDAPWNVILSPRERQVLGLLAEGMSGKEMTSVLGLSSNTVRSYCDSLLGKLGSTSRLKALARARGAGLL